jgi:hypothetical protein
MIPILGALLKEKLMTMPPSRLDARVNPRIKSGDAYDAKISAEAPLLDPLLAIQPDSRGTSPAMTRGDADARVKCAPGCSNAQERVGSEL